MLQHHRGSFALAVITDIVIADKILMQKVEVCSEAVVSCLATSERGASISGLFAAA